MQCPLCGYECMGQEQFCPQCGKQLTPTTPEADGGNVTLSAFAAEMLREPLFLVVCILISAGTALPFLASPTNLNVFGILFTIFFWLLYARARKGFGDARSLRGISGTVCAMKVVAWVAFGILAACALLCFAGNGIGVSGWQQAAGETWQRIFPELENSLDMDTISQIRDVFFNGSLVFTVFGIVFTLFAGVLLVQAIGFGKIHTFTKSAYHSLEAEVWQPQKVRAAKGWVLTIGIFSALGGISSVGALCETAAWICLYIWLNKHIRADGTLC